MKKAMPFILLLLLASGCLGLTAELPANFLPWFSAVFPAIILSFMLVSLAYMAGSFFESQEIAMWAKNEFYQTMAVAAMVLMMFFFFSFLDDMLLPGITEKSTDIGGPFALSSNNIMTAAGIYITDVNTLITTQFSALLYLQVAIGRFENVLIKVMPGGVGFMFYLGAFFTPFSHFIGYALNMLGVAMWSIQMQLAILIFSEQYMLTLFLPIGIVLRSFPFTRAIGGAFIAIAVGLYVVYPLTFVVNMNVMHTHLSDSSGILDFAFEITQGKIFPGASGLDPFNFAWYVLRTIALGGFYIVTVPLIMMAQLIGGDSVLGEIVFSVLAYAIVLPLLNVFITLTFIRAFSQLLGADVNINSITRLL